MAIYSAVVLRGYLVEEYGQFSRYSGIESAKTGWRVDSLLIRAPDSAEFATSLEDWDQTFVEIRGHFLSEVPAADEYWGIFLLDAPVRITTGRGEPLRK